MIFVYWILLAGAVFILGVMLWLLLYEPGPAPAVKTEAVQIPDAVNPDADALWHSAVLKWPDLAVGFERHTLKHGFLLRWAGLAKEEGAYLFDTVHENVFALLMRASERMIAEHTVPSHGFWVMVPLSPDCHTECALEAARLLRSMQKEVALVIEEYPSFDHFFNDDRNTAQLCVGHRSHLEITADSISTQFAVQDNAYAESAYEAIADELPLRLRLQMRVFRKKGIRSLMKLVPKTAGWYRTTAARDGSRFILTSPLTSVPEKDISALRTAAGDVRVIRETNASVYLERSSKIYRDMEGVVLALFDVRPCIPVLSDEPELWKGMHVIGFAPVSGPSDAMTDASVRFYQEILR